MTSFINNMTSPITFGIECFRSENCPLLGDLKVFPADFIVREINLNGEIAGIHNSEEPQHWSNTNKKHKLQSAVTPDGESDLPLSVDIPEQKIVTSKTNDRDISVDSIGISKQELESEPMIQNSDLPIDDKNDDNGDKVGSKSAFELPEYKIKNEMDAPITILPSAKPFEFSDKSDQNEITLPIDDKLPESPAVIKWDEIFKNPKLHLISIIGEENIQKISDTDSINDLTIESNIGCFNNKNDRSIIHQCIRYCFPSVMSGTCKIGNNTEVTCKVDPIYMNLLRNGVEPDAAKRLLVFVHCRLLTGKLNNASAEFVLDVTNFDRRKRKILHHTIHNKFGKFMESKTLVRYNKHWISVRFKEKKKQPKAKKRTREDVYCITLIKENMEHLHAIRELSRALNVHISKINHAGMKDKIAKTFQYLSLKDISPDNIEKVSELSYNGWSITKPTMIPKELQLGNLLGNHFEILLRNVRNAEPDWSRTLQDTIHHSVNNLQSNGFINYYGQQRFGLDLTSTKIGVLILQEKFKEAVETMFEVTPEELETSKDDPFVQAKEMFMKNGNVKRAVAVIPHYKTRESLILKGINKFSFDEEGCIKGFLYLPYECRLFYVHSYCSLIWNQVVSRRIQKHGFKILLGDLVKSDVTTSDVKCVTEDEINRGVYTFKDIVFPLPGSMIQLPDNDSREVYLDILKSVGLELKDFQSKKLRLYKIPGSYRKVVEIVKAFNWKLNTDEDGANNILLTFSLSPSTYATMVIREIMHTIKEI